MKKLFLLSLIPLVLCGCKKEKQEENNLSFLVPVPAPAVALSAFAEYKNFQTNTKANEIKTAMAAGQPDVVVLPTDIGVGVLKNGAPYKILCTVTFGNFYIASTGNDDDNVMDADDYVVIFQKAAIPGKIFNYVYGTELFNSAHPVADVEAAAKCLKTGINAEDGQHVDYVLMAEPALTKVLSTTPTASVYEDVQAKYKEKAGDLILTQASVFVKNTLSNSVINDEIYSKLSTSINLMINTPSEIANFMNKIDKPANIFGIDPSIAVSVTENGNRMGLGCKKASEIKDDINNFLSIFGVEQLSDENIAQ